MAPYAEPTTNKGSFRFGSQLHLLKDLTTALRPGGRSGLSSWVGVWLAGGKKGRRGVFTCWCSWQGPRAGESSLVSLYFLKAFFFFFNMDHF